MINTALLTLDVDWAPDFVIDWVAKRLIAGGVKATWFITHASPAVERLREHPDLFELGIHPNFLPNSTQGSTSEAILKFCMEMVPDAVSMRTHGLFQSSPLIAQIMSSTPIKVDSSLFLPYMPHLQPIKYYFNGGLLVRMPYFWEDDFEMERPNPCWHWDETTFPDSGLKIFDFHPIHLYLNSASMVAYYALKAEVRRLQEAAPSQVDPHVFPGEGAQTMFNQLIESQALVNSMTLAQAAQRYLLQG